MNPEEIRDIAIDSADAYFDYLNDNEKGVQEVDVFEISYPNARDLLIKLRLAAKLFDTESIFFRNYRDGKQYDTSQIKIIEYDSDRNILLIKPCEEVVDVFSNLRNVDIKVVSDLKFLIQRVKTWYELNGSKIGLPKNKSKLYDNFGEIEYFDKNHLYPSSNQKESIKNIFKESFSYIWGAPGTGKTQFVLSYAVLHYIKNGYKIAILAPTNNSIEQVLRGVIKMTTEAGIDRNKIIRLGTPSKKFAEEYPEVCEEKGVQKKLNEIDKQINILERIITYEQAITQLEEYENGLMLFDNISILISKFDKSKAILENETKNRKKKEIDVKFAKEENSALYVRKDSETKKLTSLTNRIKKFFSSKTTVTENVLSKIEESIRTKAKEIEFLLFELSELEQFVKEKKLIADLNKTAVIKQFEEIKEIYKSHYKLSSIIKDINEENWNEKKGELISELNTEKELRNIDSHLFADYKNTPLAQLQNTLSSYLEIRNKLAKYSTEERLKSVNVIACTLDGYIGRYTESKLNVEHIFLDEAGYANVIKAMTLFNHTVPITFLGDHMQLPPVCEINDSEIRNNEIFRNMFLWAQSAIFIEFLFSNDKDFCLNQYLNNLILEEKVLKKTSLDATFRFGNNLAAILQKHVYRGNFSSSNSLGETQILYINAPRIDLLRSWQSTNEVVAIQSIVTNIKKLDDNIKEDSFIILSPYRKQIRLLNQALPQERNDLRILTVHGSQGREWDTVILSVVDTSDMFLVNTKISKGLKLINTAVSRARKKLIIVCDKNYWLNQENQLITDLLNCGIEIEN